MMDFVMTRKCSEHVLSRCQLKSSSIIQGENEGLSNKSPKTYGSYGIENENSKSEAASQLPRTEMI